MGWRIFQAVIAFIVLVANHRTGTTQNTHAAALMAGGVAFFATWLVGHVIDLWRYRVRPAVRLQARGAASQRQPVLLTVRQPAPDRGLSGL